MRILPRSIALFAVLIVLDAPAQPNPAARGSDTTPRVATANRAPSSGEPAITAISPASGPIASGTEVTLSGSGLAGAEVRIEGAVTTPLSHTADRVIVSIPPGPNGYVVISARTPRGAAYAEFVREPPRLADLRPGDITTVAGVGAFFGEGRRATDAMVEATDIALGAGGEIFIAEPGLQKIRVIGRNRILEGYAGTGIEGPSPDGGVAGETHLWQARGIALDPAGNLYYADAFSHRVRRVDAATRIVTTIAGTGESGFSGDGGPARAARLSFPVQIAFDSVGNLFILECGNSRVRRIDPSGVITTVAGTGVPGFSGDGGPATAAQINIGDGTFIDAGGIATDPGGSVYIADTNNNRVRRIDRASGVMTTIVEGFSVRAVTTDAQGNIYYANDGIGAPTRPRIVKLDSQGRVVASFGRGQGLTPDGAAAADAPLGFIDRVRVDSSGHIYYTDYTALRVRRIHAGTGRIETVAGIGIGGIGDTGPGTRAVLGIFNGDLAFDAQGRLLVADGGMHRIRRIDASGNIGPFAGSGVFGLLEPDDQPASNAQIIGPTGVHVGPDGRVFVINAHDVRAIGPDGILRLVAGNTFRDPGYSGDGGPAIGARFLQPWDVRTDAAGNLYIADTNNNRVRRVDRATGIVTTIAGSGPANGFERYGFGTTCGDGGPATSACINTPYGVALDGQGNLFISENWQRIRKITSSGVISTLAEVYATKMAIDGAGNIFAVANTRIVRVSPQGVVTPIAGTGESGFSGDGGPALSARLGALGQASGVAIAPNGDLYFVDGGNRRVRVIKGGALLP